MRNCNSHYQKPHKYCHVSNHWVTITEKMKTYCVDFNRCLCLLIYPSFSSGRARFLMLLPILFLAFPGAVIGLAALSTNHHFLLPFFTILTCSWLGNDCFGTLKLLLWFISTVRDVSKLAQGWQKIRQTWWLHKWKWPSTQAWTFCNHLRFLTSQFAAVISKQLPFSREFLHTLQIFLGWFVVELCEKVKHTSPGCICWVFCVTTKAPLTKVSKTCDALITGALKHTEQNAVKDPLIFLKASWKTLKCSFQGSNCPLFGCHL